MKNKILLATASLVLAQAFPSSVLADQSTSPKQHTTSEVSSAVDVYTGGRIVMTRKDGGGSETLIYSRYDGNGSIVEQQIMTTDNATGAYTLQESKRDAKTGSLTKDTKLGMLAPQEVIAKH